MKDFQNKQELKEFWINKPNNDNFLQALTHPHFNTILSKVAETSKTELLNKPF